MKSSFSRFLNRSNHPFEAVKSVIPISLANFNACSCTMGPSIAIFLSRMTCTHLTRACSRVWRGESFIICRFESRLVSNSLRIFFSSLMNWKSVLEAMEYCRQTSLLAFPFWSRFRISIFLAMVKRVLLVFGEVMMLLEEVLVAFCRMTKGHELAQKST